MLTRFRNYFIARRLRKMAPSELLSLALDTFDSALASPNYEIDMGVWRQRLSDERTAVCFAGAFWSEQFVIPSMGWSYVWPQHPGSGLPSIAYNIVLALDFVRCGDVGHFFGKLGRNVGDGLRFNTYVTSYSTDPVRWRAQLHQIIRELQKEGY